MFCGVVGSDRDGDPTFFFLVMVRGFSFESDHSAFMYRRSLCIIRFVRRTIP